MVLLRNLNLVILNRVVLQGLRPLLLAVRLLCLQAVEMYL